MDHWVAPQHGWKERTQQFGARSSERPQDNMAGDDIGFWQLEPDGEPRWRHAEHRRRHFI